MKCVLGCCAHVCAGVIIIVSLIAFPLAHGTPSRFSLFQGSPYSSSASRQRNKNWCAFVVQKNVSCAVLSREPVACPPQEPDCAQQIMFHTRPMYKIGYKQVTELEWRCCPGYQGHDCTDLRDTQQRPSVVEEQRPHSSSSSLQHQSALGTGPEVYAETHPWIQHGQKGHRSSHGDHVNQHENRRVQVLEREVERLTQTVLDLQASTSANANLRLDLQEDVTKFVLNMLGNLQQPQDAKAGQIESIVFPSDLRSPSVTDELQNHISTNANSIQDLQVRIQSLDGQLHRLTEAANHGAAQPTASANKCSCQAYVDDKISALREELLQGMDIKIADMKNACDYKMMSVQEQCEERETSYFSLAELLDSKEAELRKDIQDLRLQIESGKDEIPTGKDYDLELQDFKDTIRRQNETLTKVEEHGRVLEERVGLVEKSAEVHYLYLEEKLRRERLREEDGRENSTSQIAHDQRLDVLEKQTKKLQDEIGSFVQQINRDLNQSARFETLQRRVGNLEVDFGRSRERLTGADDLLKGLDGRVGHIESVCGRFEPMSDSLRRIKDGLNKHVNGLWTCVRQLNSSVLAHTRDIEKFRANSQLTKDGHDGITNAPTGVLKATAPIKVSMEGSRALPSGEAGPRINGSGADITGYAGAPGYPAFPAAAVGPDSVSAQIPLKTVQMAAGEARLVTYVSFSAGLTLIPFPGEIGIIRFNNVLLNDGKHYDPQTGVFTAPVDGRYLLTAVLTAQAGARVEAFLSVSSRNVQRLQSSGSESCACGGSAALSLTLHLKRGQRAGLVLTAGTLAISSSSEILSSFSGVLLYPTLGHR